MNVCLDFFCLEMCVDCYHPKKKKRTLHLHIWIRIFLSHISFGSHSDCVLIYVHIVFGVFLSATGGCLSVIYSVCPLAACTSSVPLHRFRHVHRNFLTPAITDWLPPCYRWPAESVDARKYGRAPAAAAAAGARVSCASFFVLSQGGRTKQYKQTK